MAQKSNHSQSPPPFKFVKKTSTASNMSVQSEKFVKHNLHEFEKDYEVVTKLGEGTFGSIFRVKHKQLKLDRALKIISKKNKPDQPIPRQQINALIKLDHPNIIKIYEFYENKDFYYIVTELFNGRQLFDELVEEDVFTETKAAKVSADILKAIHYMHQQNLVHRDIKPENILIKTQGNKSWIKLIDFGLGVSNSKNGLTDKIGTPEYIAPEVISGKYDEKCDVWGFGVILHTMLGGDMPFLGNTQQEVLEKVKKAKITFNHKSWEKVSSEGKDLVSKLLERNVKNRLSAEQALKHPWFKKFLSPSAQPVQLKQTLNRLKEFQLENHLHTAAYSYINNHMSSLQQKRQLDQIFSFLDTNNNGVLEFDELLEGYKSMYGEAVGSLIAEEVFNKLDYNHSGKIQYNQFITYALLKHKQVPRSHLEETFKLFDLNRDGKISTEQLKRILSNGIQDIDQSEWDAIIKSIDKNDDGEISKEEFFECMTKVSEICASTLSKLRKESKSTDRSKVKTLSSSSISTRRSLRSKAQQTQRLDNIPEVIEMQASQELANFI